MAGHDQKTKDNYNEKEHTMDQDPAYCKLEEKTTVAGKKNNGSYTFVIMWNEGPAALEERLPFSIVTTTGKETE